MERQGGRHGKGMEEKSIKSLVIQGIDNLRQLPCTPAAGKVTFQTLALHERFRKEQSLDKGAGFFHLASLPISGSEREVSSVAKYMETCLGHAMELFFFFEFKSSMLILKYLHTTFFI